MGPLLFNIYINDLFYVFLNSHVCNFADDTSLSDCDISLEDLLRDLENDTLSAIMWFENNYMKLNHGKCHFVISGNINEHLWIKVGDEMIWESADEKLLGMIIDKRLNFNKHLTLLCKKAGNKVTALARVVKLLPFHKSRVLMKSFVESQFSYCPLLWMFCSRKMNRKINHIHERGLRLVYNDYCSTFEELLLKDKTICIHHRNIHQVAIEMFKVKHNLSPPFMKKIFNYTSEGRTTRSGDKFERPSVNKVKMGEQSLRNYGPVLWNTMLPDKLKECSSLEIFKESIKSWVPDCHCKICKNFIEGVGYIETFE